jgi:hypothetical protein
METKICVCCGKVLPIESFGRNRQSSDGRMVTCKECTNKRYRENYKKRKNITTTTAPSSTATVTKPKLDDNGRNPDLSKFHARELIAELKARGYKGEIFYVQKTVF